MTTPKGSKNKEDLLFRQAISRGDLEEIQSQLRHNGYMHHLETAMMAMNALSESSQRQCRPLSKKTTTAVTRVLLKHVSTPIIWHNLFKVACQNMDMDLVWPELARSLEKMQPQSMDSVLKLALQTQKAPLPTWMIDALQRQPNDQKFSGSVFWLAAQHPDPTLLVQLMQHPAKPTPKDIMDVWVQHFDPHPLHLDEVRKHVQPKEVLTEAMHWALMMVAQQVKTQNLDDTMQFWWDALTYEEKNAWMKLHAHTIQETHFGLPNGKAWYEQHLLQTMVRQEQQALQAGARMPKKQKTRKTRL